MDYKVILSQACINDLAEIVGYISQHDSAAAKRTGGALIDRAISLAQHPRRGPSMHGCPEVRRLVLKSFLIFYEINETLRTVEVLRFWHAAQDPKSLRLRDES